MRRPAILYNTQRLFRPGGHSAAARALGATSSDGWTAAAYRAKINAIAAVLRDAAQGTPPALLLLVVVEDASVVTDVCRAASWPDMVDVAVPGEQVDGYDVAIAYDKTCFPGGIQCAESHQFTNRFSTRDLVVATLRLADGSAVTVLNTHWASRTMPEGQPLRYAAAAYCASVVERLLKFPREDLITPTGKVKLPSRDELTHRWTTPILCGGDFNDAPWDPTVRSFLRATPDPALTTRSPRFPSTNSLSSAAAYLSQRIYLHNPTWPVATGPQPQGTHKFDGEFTPLDQFLVSPGLLTPTPPCFVPDSVRVHAPTSVVAPDGSAVEVCTRGGEPIPFEPRARRGASDHLPLVAQLEFKDADGIRPA